LSGEHTIRPSLAPPEKGSEHAIINSALWAAAGDALGWITELSRGESGVQYRAGVPTVSEPIAWHRLVDGRNGPRVDLPAGTYSDDTQLRLAVSRAIRGSGLFDVEAFAKIELTVWPSYALGGGLGTKAAALNLSRRGVNWFSNFFESSQQQYVNTGGNGAAMRVQPHVWASSGDTDELILNVLRDALVTHGHPQGFCGAVFHALILAQTLKNATIPMVDSWVHAAERFVDIPNLITNDRQLAAFWLSTWEEKSGRPLKLALSAMRDEALGDIDRVSTIEEASSQGYYEILKRLGCLTSEFRGSGFKTALASSVLSRNYGEANIEAALGCAANNLESDTDTIATMAGAILGVVANRPPPWMIQDREYITDEASRLAAIASKKSQDSFTYPDLGRWNPPTRQTASVGRSGQGLALAGLGQLTPTSREYIVGDAIWQWFVLPFKQTLLAKRKVNLNESIDSSQLPGPRQKARVELRETERSRPNMAIQSSLPLDNKIDYDSEPYGIERNSIGALIHLDRSKPRLRSQRLLRKLKLRESVEAAEFSSHEHRLRRRYHPTQSKELYVGVPRMWLTSPLAISLLEQMGV
jgi:ADP-ribosylglycohydrolase